MTKNAIAAIGSVCALLLCAPHSFGDALSLSGTSLNVTGPTTLQGSLNVTGSTTLSMLDVTGLASLQDLTLRDLIVSGTTDISGNLLYFGSWLDNPDEHGVSLLYTDRTSTSTPSRLTFSATWPLHEWSWEHEKADQSGTVPTMKLDANHVLTIYNMAGNPGIVLDPSNPSSPTAVLTQQAADARYVSSANYKVGPDMWGWGTTTLALTGGTASGPNSFAAPYATASANYAMAFGNRATANAQQSTAIGQYSSASGTFSTAIGWYAIASGEGSEAHGGNSVSSGTDSSAFGKAASATGAYSSAVGTKAMASGKYSTALGYNSRANGTYAYGAGADIIAAGFGQFAVGQANISQGNSTQWVPTDDLFTIGNGAIGYTDPNGVLQPASRSNAFVVKKNGNTTVYGKLTVSASNGSTAATPSGFSIAYNDGTDGVDSAITLQSSRPSSVWNWQRTSTSGSATTVMQIDASNRLILTGTATTNPPQLVLDPNGSAALNGSSLLTKTAADDLYVSSSIGLSASNGNIGIGTTTPTAKLDVAGNLNVASGSSSALFVNATNGHVGIGTTTALAPLTIDARPYTENGFTYGQIVVGGSGGSKAGSIIFRRQDGSPTGQVGYNSGTEQNNLVIRSNGGWGCITLNSQNGEALRMDTNGKIGIGTGSQIDSKLHVVGNQILSFGAPSGALNIGADANLTTRTNNSRKLGVIAAPDYSNTRNIELITSDSFTPIDNRVFLGGRPGGSGYAATDICFTTSPDVNTTGGNARMVIDRAGFVGIGTTTPQALLDVNGNAKVSGNLGISGAGSLTLPDGTVLSGSHTLSNVITSGTAAYALASTTTAALSGAIQASQVNGLAAVATTGAYSSLQGRPTTLAGYGITDPIVLSTGSYSNPNWISSLAYTKLTGAPTNVSAFTNDVGYIAESGTANNLALSGSTKVTGGLVVTGSAVEVVSGTTTTTKIVSSGTAQLVLIPEQGDLSMGNFTNGIRPQ